MVTRQAGRRVRSVASQHRAAGKRRRAAEPTAPKAPRRGRREVLEPRERRRLLQLVVSGGVFVLLVAVKLLLPGKMAQMDQRLSGMLEQNIDVEGVFAAVGRAVSGKADMSIALQDMYQAVFDPQAPEAVEASAPAAGQEADIRLPDAIGPLRAFRAGTGSADGWLDMPAPPESSADEANEPVGELTETASAGETEASTLAYVLYSAENLPEDVCLEQSVLGFDYATPAQGTLTSPFGYREHPIQGEELFHYGLDIANVEGTDICAFADGTVKATGESSSFGKYLMLSHENGYTTLYAHCSQVVASAGQQVAMGEKIAEMGSTGNVTGTHLHFELMDGSTYLNPIYYVEVH